MTGPRRIVRQVVPVAGFADTVAAFPDSLADRAARIAAAISAPRAALALEGRTVRFDAPQVMAILNVTPDSFSDGGGIAAILRRRLTRASRWRRQALR